MTIDRSRDPASDTRRGEVSRSARIPRRSLSIRALVLGLIVLASPGCGDRDEPAGFRGQAVKVDELPEAVRGAAKKAMPGVSLDEAWKNLDRAGKLESYEIRGRAANGKIREVRISLTGAVLEEE